MANIYNGLLYNDDVNMSLEEASSLPSTNSSSVDDDSTYKPPEPPKETVPEVTSIDASDTLIRILDGWEKDLSTNGGTPGETYTAIPPVEKPENPGQKTKTIYSQTQIIISDYSQSYLNALNRAGYDFYVIYTDGTRDKVLVSEIVDPHPAIDRTIQVETQAIAKAINQYFWHDTNGVHVTDTPQENWFEALYDDFPNWPIIPYHNILMNSFGILLRTQLINLASLSRSGVAFFDGQGNESSNILASFGINGSVLRANGRDVLRVTPNGVIFVPLEGEEVSVTMITDNIDNLTNVVEVNKQNSDEAIEKLQNQLDGVVDTYYEEVDPEYDDILTDSFDAHVLDSSNVIVDIHFKTHWSIGWNTDEIKAAHEGDLYYNILTGHVWRWLKTNNTWSWFQLSDTDVSQALKAAREASISAGTKRRVFVDTPSPPYDIGDIWVTGSEVCYATIAKATGEPYAESDWSLTATDDTLARTALNAATENADDILELKGDVTIVKRDYVTKASYEQNNQVWSANLDSLETSVKEYSDSLITTEVVNRNAAITAESNSIRQMASATYQVKGDYATNTALQNEITNRNAAIETSAGNILQSVSETYATMETLGTYINQTADSITTIIGDIDTVQSIIHYQEDSIKNANDAINDKINAYYGNTDPFSEGEITDSSNSKVLSSSDSSITFKTLNASSESYKWITDYARSQHVGDLYFNTLTGKSWKYGETYQWEYIPNKDAEDALEKAIALEELNLPSSIDQAITDARAASQAANNANTLASSKTRTFTTTPTPPYNVGDMWVDGHTVKYCITAASSGSYNASHWSTTATDDTSLNTYKDDLATIIRDTSNGVLVAKAGSNIGSLQASNNFQIIGINSWSGSTPSIGSTFAKFAANGLSIYDNAGSNEISFFGVDGNLLPFTRLGQANRGNIQIGVNQFGNGYIDFYSNDVLLGHLGYDSGQNDEGGYSYAPYHTFGLRYPESVIGNYSLAEGYYNIASGAYSHAEGWKSVASDTCSHAEGNTATASGGNAHAEGSLTVASGNSAHAEGGYTTASGNNSHAEGNNTTASNNSAHAEGGSTKATAQCAHAEGNGTEASASGSHAEGDETTASGSSSHAEGSNTTASENSAHAEGGYSKAKAQCAHAEGSGTEASGTYSHAEGLNTIVKSTGSAAHAEGSGTEASGSSSHAEGSNTTASENSAHAEGSSTTASGSNSHAEGRSTTASNNYAHAEGYSSTASAQCAHAEGSETTASGSNSHAEGSLTVASSNSAHVEGGYTKATAQCAHAEGNNTEASGTYSHAEGLYTIVKSTGSAAHAEGNTTTASGSNSHAEGSSTTASNNSAHAEGYSSTASGSYSHAEGYSTTASGTGSHSEGASTTSKGTGSHAEGYNTQATADGAHAEGYGTVASGSYSHAECAYTTASGGNSHATGYYTTAGYTCQFVCGKYNSNSSSDLFEVGNGSSSSRANAFRVTTSNTAYVGSTQVTSDKRIKTDLGILDESNSVAFVKSLIPHKYEKFGRKELGFFAQDVEEDPNYGDILVELSKEHGFDDFRNLSYDGLIAPIVSAMQNILKRLEKLENERT